MTVFALFPYTIRPYTGYQDPGLPIGAYIAQGGAAGNASGGQLIIEFEFMPEQEELITELFNLESLEIDTDAGILETSIMETINLDTLSRNRPASKRKWQFTTTVHDSDSALRQDLALVRPIWLGSPNLDARAGTGGLRFSFTNIDLRLYAVTIQGYIWGPRSVLAPGGPRRPPDGGLFGG